MRLAALAAPLLAAALSSGCLVVGLHPFYDESAIEFDEALVGVWENAEDKAELRVERGQWRSYRIAYAEDGSTETFTGYLTRVGPVRLLDLSPFKVPEGTSLLAPVHLPVRVQLLGDSLSLALLDYDWFRAEVERGRLAALGAARGEDGNVVFTAPTAGVRAWMATHASEHFDEAARFSRKPAGQAP
ncbi:MAG: hypothetical protein H6Q10_740 [Acidobacteria bacterium]|jgi:hypothetical protein|nr:hypothetical protein [Acidobacteriota bacterium]